MNTEDLNDVSIRLPPNETNVLIRREETGKKLDGTIVTCINYLNAFYLNGSFLIDGNHSCSHVTHWIENPPTS